MKLQTKIAVIAVSSALVGSLIGCNRPTQTASRDSDNSMAQSSGSYGSSSGTTGSGSSAGSSSSDSSSMGSSTASDTVAMADPSITAKIKAAYLKEPGLKSMDIHVETNNGIAILTGTVDSQATIDRAQQLASSVEGVKSVDNRLTVKSGGMG